MSFVERAGHTSPVGLTFTDVAEELARAVGRPAEFVSVRGDEWVAGALAAGVPSTEAEFLAALFPQLLDGRNSTPMPRVPEVLGRTELDLSEYATAAAAAGAWSTG